MSAEQDLGIGGLALKSTDDLSGTASDVANGNAIGTTYKNGIGMAVVADASNAGSFVLAGANKPILGVLNNNPKAGEVGDIRGVRGSSRKVLAGGVINVGDALSTDLSGRFVAASGAAQIIVAVAVEAATAAGQLIQAVLLDSYVA